MYLHYLDPSEVVSEFLHGHYEQILESSKAAELILKFKDVTNECTDFCKFVQHNVELLVHKKDDLNSFRYLFKFI